MGKPPKPSSIQSQFSQLIAAKANTSGASDGRLQVALAIASVSSLVTVDATVHPFTTKPVDLFDRAFNDNQVGLDDEQMASFKASLSVLLPQIQSDIIQIPENSALEIEDVAEFVRVSLLATHSNG